MKISRTKGVFWEFGGGIFETYTKFFGKFSEILRVGLHIGFHQTWVQPMVNPCLIIYNVK